MYKDCLKLEEIIRQNLLRLDQKESELESEITKVLDGYSEYTSKKAPKWGQIASKMAIDKVKKRVKLLFIF